MAAATGPLKINLTISCTETNAGSGTGATDTVHRHLLEYSKTLANGTSGDEQDLCYSIHNGSVVNGVPDTIDLAGSLTQHTDTSSTHTFVEMVAIALVHTGGTGDLEIGAGGSNPFITMWKATGDGAVIGPGTGDGSVFLWTSFTNGGTVTAGSGDVLQLISSSGTVTYKMVLVGRSA